MFSSSMVHKFLLSLLKGLFLCAMTMYMELCVMTSGMNLRPELSADNLDSQQQAVSYSENFISTSSVIHLPSRFYSS